MATFKIGIRTKIARIPGHPKAFQRGEEYSTENAEEIRELRERPEYVAEEILEEGEEPEELPEVPEKKPQLETVLDQKAIRDEMLTTDTGELRKRKFPDGVEYGKLWVMKMNKQRFVRLVMDELGAQETG